MQIAIDIGEMNELRGRLRDAAAGVADAVPAMPGAGAFGPAVVAVAATSFEAAMRRKATRLRDRWDVLDSGVSGTFDDMNEIETTIIDVVQRLTGPLR